MDNVCHGFASGRRCGSMRHDNERLGDGVRGRVLSSEPSPLLDVPVLSVPVASDYGSDLVTPWWRKVLTYSSNASC